jgi:hypothetical protein
MKGRLRVTVSTFQLGVLVHFDTADRDTVTFGELSSATLLQEQQLKMALLAMLKLKFISCAAGAKHTTWDESTEFSLVKNFKSARNRINAQRAGRRRRPQVGAAGAGRGARGAPRARAQAAGGDRAHDEGAQDDDAPAADLARRRCQVQKWFTPKVATSRR